MLDELMGKDRDLLPDEASRHQSFDDPDVCKWYLCGFCPHDLFTNTKTDLGPCTSAHDDALVEAYKRSSKFKKKGYEEDFLRYLQQIKNDCEKRIKRANQRLSQAPNQNLGNPRTSSLQIIENKITTLLEKVESLGNEGKVEEAQAIMKQIDQLRKDKENLQSHIGGDNPNEKQMEVCTICGAFLIVGDAPSRVDDHLKGKQHTGFAKVRSAIAQLREELYNIREEDSSLSNPIPSKSQSRSPVRRRRSSSEGRTRGEEYHRKTRESNKPTTEQFDYDDMLQKESERRNIYPEELPQVEKPRKHHRSRSRSRSGRRNRNERRSRSRDNKKRDRSRSAKKDDRHSSSRRKSRDRKRSRSRDKKAKKESTKSSRHRDSRSKSHDGKRSSSTHGSKHSKSNSKDHNPNSDNKSSNGPSSVTNESSSSNNHS